MTNSQQKLNVAKYLINSIVDKDDELSIEDHSKLAEIEKIIGKEDFRKLFIELMTINP
jgi:hypothetical protein